MRTRNAEPGGFQATMPTMVPQGRPRKSVTSTRSPTARRGARCSADSGESRAKGEWDCDMCSRFASGERGARLVVGHFDPAPKLEKLVVKHVE